MNDYSGETALTNALWSVGAIVATSICIASVACGFLAVAAIGAVFALGAYFTDTESTKWTAKDAAISAATGAITNATLGRLGVKAAGTALFNSKSMGIDSRLFGHRGYGLRNVPTENGGKLNNRGRKHTWRIGWSNHAKNKALVFAVRYGEKGRHYNLIWGGNFRSYE